MGRTVKGTTESDLETVWLNVKAIVRETEKTLGTIGQTGGDGFHSCVENVSGPGTGNGKDLILAQHSHTK